MFILNNQETIIAPITSCEGAISLVRLSGSNAIAIVDEILLSKKALKNKESHTITLGIIKRDDDSIIDEVLVSLFKNPHSYTGEDVVEISCHGSKYIQSEILQLALKKGAVLAQPGEFTFRAFMNGKLDLTQAEAVADIIASESKATHEIAMNQMRGGVTNEIQKLRKEFINFAALIELELDFSEEDVEFADRAKFGALLNEIKSLMLKMIASFEYGNVIKKGVPVAIAGKPNAGKSSLLNALLNDDKAIVSDIAGTTRDSIEDTLNHNGIIFRFIDTAGLRDTTDTIEAIGVQRTKNKINEAKILLYLFDENDTTSADIINDVKSFYREDLITILVQNKIDLQGGFLQSKLKEEVEDALFGQYTSTIVGISTQQPDTIKSLLGQLSCEIEALATNTDVVITNTRHLQALKNTTDCIDSIQNNIKIGISGDLLSIDIRQALRYLGEITGEIDMDTDILGAIFSTFCIGK